MKLQGRWSLNTSPKPISVQDNYHHNDSHVGWAQSLQGFWRILRTLVVERGPSNIKTPRRVNGELSVDKIFVILPSQSWKNKTREGPRLWGGPLRISWCGRSQGEITSTALDLGCSPPFPECCKHLTKIVQRKIELPDVNVY